MSPHRLAPVVVAALLVALAPSRAGASTVEDYASYQPARHCATAAKPGAEVLATWIVETFGGRLGGIWRACDGSTSEHQEGRAIDWTLDASKKADRRRAAKLRARLFATDAEGNAHALARRMGVMYVIWDDRMWSAWDGFTRSDYRSSSCPSLRRCSPTLRHRDHVHISLTRAAARGETSWYADRLPTTME